jgi:carboxymethylenebutenolidase
MCHAPADVPSIPTEILGQEVPVPLPSGERIPTWVCDPETSRRGVVLLAHDIYGRTQFYRNLTVRLSAAGYVGLLPDFLFREGDLPEPTREAAFARRARLDEMGALRDLGAVIDWAKDRWCREDDRVGMIGFCLGGTLALDLAAERQDLATVCYYAFPASLPGPLAAPAPLDLVREMTGPILAFWGEDEEVVDMRDVTRFGAAMAAARVDYEQVVYPAAGHGFLAHSNLEEGNPLAVPALDSWNRSLAFFSRHLGARVHR